MDQELDPFRDAEFPTFVKNKIGFKARFGNGAKRTYRGLKAVAPITATLALIISVVGIYNGYPVYRNFNYTNPATDGYVAPRSPGDVVARVLEGTVVVNCNPIKGESTLGSGWSIDLKPSSKQYKSSIITNHHVIADCLNGKGEITIVDSDEKKYETAVDILDKENDLAKLSTDLEVKPLEMSENAPWAGYWVMTAGSSDGYQGSVSFGSVMNATMTEIFITANISHGNSGGPLVDNEGLVIGTNSWGRIGEQYNGAMSLDAMCAKILKCKYAKGKEFWEYK